MHLRLPGPLLAVAALEVAGLLVGGVLLVRVAGGAPGPGEVVAWARHSPLLAPALPSLTLPSARPSATPPGPGLGTRILDRLDRDTGTAARLQYALIVELENAFATRIAALLDAVQGGGP